MKNLQLTYKLKLILIVCIGIILCFIVYNKKIKPTLERINKINQLEESTGVNESLTNSKLNDLLKQEKEIEKMLSSDDSLNFESYLIKELTRFNTNIEIVHVSDLYKYKDGGYLISNLTLTLKNDYKTILKLIDYIEKELNIVNVISVDFYSKKINFKTTKKNLYAKIHIQNIKNS